MATRQPQTQTQVAFPQRGEIYLVASAEHAQNGPRPRQEHSGVPQRLGAAVNQIRSADRRRLVKRLGRLDTAAMRRVDHALMISLGLVPL